MLSLIKKYSGISSYTTLNDVELLDNWISDVPIYISIPKYDKKFRKYLILIEHGTFKWSVYRKYNEVQTLKYRFYQGSFTKYVFNFFFGVDKEVPTYLDFFWNYMNKDFIDKLERYLQNLANDKRLRNHPILLQFFQVSYMSFNTEYGTQKGLEGLARKKDYQFFGTSGNRLKRFLEQWEPCWVVLKDDYLVYLNINLMTIDGVLLLDHTVQIDHLQNRILIVNKTRMFQLEFEDSDKNLWASHLKETVYRLRRWINNALSIDLDDERRSHRFDSFMPPRDKSQCRWFIDGGIYFAKVADALCAAQKEIFISAWWLSPQIYLKRPLINSSDVWRFDNIIKRKADEGVKIYILIYKEIPAAMGLKSSYSKKILKNLHPHNIYVLRHPYHLKNSVIFWSHHEKIVCVDQRIVFLGGLDICYGRWDSQAHELVDLGPKDGQINLGPNLMNSITKLTCPKNILEEHYSKLWDFESDDGYREKLKRVRLLLSVALTFAKQRKTKSSEIKVDTGERDFKILRKLEKSLSIRGNPEGTNLSELDYLGSGKYWIGKDYSNFIYKDFAELDEPFTDLIDREKIPRMPWHDIGVVIFDQAAKDVARHFIERWNQTLIEKYKPNIPYLLPKHYLHLPHFPTKLKTNAEHCNIQICRSSTTWSAGLKCTENSIENAYVTLIKKSKHFIYIENQFFISIHDHPAVHNRISDALFNRLSHAISNHETFRVFIVMPLLPGFEGEIGEKTGTFIETMIYWTNLSLNMGPNSLIQRLKSIVDDPFKYISICGLRKYDMLRQTLVSELIYVHSKLLIVDDEMCIIGSANINDRSLLGDRDSEIAAIIDEDQIKVDGLMNNKVIKIGKFVSSLRKSLFKEHLMGTSAMNDVDIEDPICDKFFKAWNQRASLNTNIYEEVFRCIPTNQVKSLKELRIYRKTPSLAQSNIPLAMEKLNDIRGTLVHYPLNFFVEDIGESDSKTKKLLSALGCDSPLSILYT